MIEKKFKLTLVPDFEKSGNFMNGIRGLIGININDIDIYENSETGRNKFDNLFYPLRWLRCNYHLYTQDWMPSYVTPAVDLVKVMEKDKAKYWEKESSGWSFGKKGEEKTSEWLFSHLFNQGNTEQYVVFQKSLDQMEISWSINHAYYKNPTGTEYVSFNYFKNEIISVTDDVVNKIKDNKLIRDYDTWSYQLILSGQ